MKITATPIFPDTDPRIEEMLIEAWRHKTAAERLGAVCTMWRTQVRLAEAGLRSRYPGAGPEERQERLCALLYGREIAMRVHGSGSGAGGILMDEPLAVALLVAGALEAAGADYLIGGSLASGLYGLGRATMDADLVSSLQAGQVRVFLERLGPEFYVDEDAVREAIERHGSFNLVHLPAMFKVDVFIPPVLPFHASVFQRRRRQEIGTDPVVEAYFASPEDVILTKLDWAGKCGGSERQWRDVLAIVKTQGGRLDLGYLRQWAGCLAVEADLERLLAEAEAS